jgi:hypothetical protein
MSTPATPAVPATPVPATPAAEVNVNMTREQIAAAVPTPVTPAAPAIPAAVEPTPENPVVTKELGGGQFEVKYLTGETFKGTAAEILLKQGQSNYNTHQWAKLEVAKAKQPVTQEPPPPQIFANEEESKIAKYVTELQAKELGFQTVDEYKAALGRIQQNTEQFAGQNLSVMFSAAAPEFNATKENSEKLLNTVETLGLLPLMTSGDTNQQLNALRAAHAFALQTKVYEAKPAAQAAPTPPIPPPPIPTSGPVDLTTIPEDLKVDVNMPKEEIQRRIELARSRNYIF